MYYKKNLSEKFPRISFCKFFKLIFLIQLLRAYTYIVNISRIIDILICVQNWQSKIADPDQ